FDFFDKMESFDEEKLVNKFSHLKANTLANHKSLLYKTLLTSLRLLRNEDPAIAIKDLISSANVLHNKGLYRQSLSQLQKAKNLSIKNGMDILRLEVVEFEKKIETRYVTGSEPNRANDLTAESETLRHNFYYQGSWSDLSLRLYDYYLKYGLVRNKEDFEQVSSFFEKNKPNQETALGSDIIYYYQSYVWFYHITQNFTACYRYAKKWCILFEDSPILLQNEPEMYIRGFHNVLSSLFFCDDLKRFEIEFEKLERYLLETQDDFNENQRIQAFTYLETARLNLFSMRGHFSEGSDYCNHFLDRLESYVNRMDTHRVLVFRYKIASIYFGGGNYHQALKQLNEINNHPTSTLKEDIQVYARFLTVIAHFELGDDDLLFFQIKSTYRFMLKMKDFQQIHSAIFRFLRKSIYMDRSTLIPYFKELRTELLKIVEDRYEKRPMLYLDIISWLDSKLEKKSVEEIIRRKKFNEGSQSSLELLPS
ncbi:MAG: hypothetical protein AAF789_15235, partial [Bacteroidota bacterium]